MVELIAEKTARQWFVVIMVVFLIISLVAIGGAMDRHVMKNYRVWLSLPYVVIATWFALVLYLFEKLTRAVDSLSSSMYRAERYLSSNLGKWLFLDRVDKWVSQTSPTISRISIVAPSKGVAYEYARRLGLSMDQYWIINDWRSARLASGFYMVSSGWSSAPDAEKILGYLNNHRRMTRVKTKRQLNKLFGKPFSKADEVFGRV